MTKEFEAFFEWFEKEYKGLSDMLNISLIKVMGLSESEWVFLIGFMHKYLIYRDGITGLAIETNDIKHIVLELKKQINNQPAVKERKPKGG